MNYTIYHLHSDLSNGTTNIDSVTKYAQYIEKAKQLGMTALGFSEHGNIFSWFAKKNDIEKAGMKYIHGCEFYVTKSLEVKERDNYHTVLIAKNKSGFLELNKLISIASNRKDNHFYYTPRISFDELCNISDNIIVCTACCASILNCDYEDLQKRFIDFLIKHKNNAFLEIQHHDTEEQKQYNLHLKKIADKYDLRLIAGTDTHSLNKELAEARLVLQDAKHIHFGNEDGWDLTFKTYNELLEAYKRQGVLDSEVYKEAIENTNVMANSIESFDVDLNPKYPKMYDNAEAVFKEKVMNALKTNKEVCKHDKKKVLERVKEEFDVYKKTGTIDYMLFEEYLRKNELKNGVYRGAGRGSVSGSIIAYLLGITEMDSLKFDLNFFRFMNPQRVSLPDIDVDYGDKDRAWVKNFICSHDNLYTSEIITFNTIAMRGAIDDVGRALNIPLLEVKDIKDTIDDEKAFSKTRERYPELFKYVDILQGVIVSIGNHPAGIIVSPIPLDENIGLCSTPTAEQPVSQIDMSEIDKYGFVKLDLLGLDNVDVINKTCELIGIPKITPDTIDLDDWNVWKSIREDTACIFQWGEDGASNYLRRLMSDETISKIRERVPNISLLKLFSFGNGLIRPACASYRDSVANGEFYDNGFEPINDFLSKTLGRCLSQDTLISTKNGRKKIKDIIVNDEVQTPNGYKPVLNVFNNGTKQLYNIKLKNGITLKATKNHKIYTQNGYKTVSELSTKDSVLLNYETENNNNYTKGTYELIKEICIDTLDTVYDIEVQDEHCYYANNILVHNCTMQEDIMRFLCEFCGYTMAEADIVRKGIAKKKGTEQLLPEIKSRFISYAKEKFDIDEIKANDIIEPFLQTILDASAYAFSWNHSDAYSCIGYMCGWLRYYYPLEFCTTCLNVFSDTKEGDLKKRSDILRYMKKIGIQMKPVQFGKSGDYCTMDKNENAIYQGLATIKYLNSSCATQLNELAKNEYNNFTSLMIDITEKTNINKKQVQILIILNYFSKFGNNKKLFKINELFNKRYSKTHKDKTKAIRKEEILLFETDKCLANSSFSMVQQLQAEQSYLGHTMTIKEDMSNSYCFVAGMDKLYSNYMAKLYHLKTGETELIKVKNKDYVKNKFNEYDLIKTLSVRTDNKWRKTEDGFERLDETEKVLDSWEIVEKGKTIMLGGKNED